MFKKIFTSKKNDKEFTVQVVGTGPLVYTEGEKVLEIGAEVLVGFKQIVVSTRFINKWLSNDELINDDARNRIINNVKIELQKQGFEVEIV